MIPPTPKTDPLIPILASDVSGRQGSVVRHWRRSYLFTFTCVVSRR